MDKGKLNRALISAFSGLVLKLHCGYLRVFLQVSLTLVSLIKDCSLSINKIKQL